MTSFPPAVPPEPQPAYVRLPLHRVVVTWVLLALIGLAFAAETAAGGSTDSGVLIRLGAKVPFLITSGQYWRLLTSMFLHVGPMHLLFNAYALFVIGAELERILGAGRFIALYLLSGLLASLASYALSPYLAAGASGAIFGLIGAQGVFYLLYRQRLGQAGKARLGNIAFLIVLNLVLGFTMPGIDNVAHIGGLISGAALGWAVLPRYQIDSLGLRLVDRNSLARYWPALALAAAVLVAGTALVSMAQRQALTQGAVPADQTAGTGGVEVALANIKRVDGLPVSWIGRNGMGCDPRPQTVRRPVVAGRWYPGSEAALARALDEYFAHAAEQPLLSGHVRALISPHAGYAYSGQAAAYAYRQLEGRRYDRVVLLGPSHQAWVGDYAISSEEAYETPLGQVALDQEFIAALEQRVRVLRIRRDTEHALEIQLPFLQRQLGVFTLVPILMSADDPAAAQTLAGALADIVAGAGEHQGQTLLVASSDLHHIEDYEQVKRRDQRVVDAIDRFDLAALAGVLMDPQSTVCGRMPILTVLHAARSMGATQARVLYHTTSGDVTGERWPGQYTVGYMAAAVFNS